LLYIDRGSAGPEQRSFAPSWASPFWCGRLEQAASTLGANRALVFLTVTLQLITSGIIAGAILCFARSMGKFGAMITFVSNIPGETQTQLDLHLHASARGGRGRVQAHAHFDRDLVRRNPCPEAFARAVSRRVYAGEPPERLPLAP
jgi:hypothetical protein